MIIDSLMFRSRNGRFVWISFPQTQYLQQYHEVVRKDLTAWFDCQQLSGPRPEKLDGCLMLKADSVDHALRFYLQEK